MRRENFFKIFVSTQVSRIVLKIEILKLRLKTAADEIVRLWRKTEKVAQQ